MYLTLTILGGLFIFHPVIAEAVYFVVLFFDIHGATVIPHAKKTDRPNACLLPYGDGGSRTHDLLNVVIFSHLYNGFAVFIFLKRCEKCKAFQD